MNTISELLLTSIRTHTDKDAVIDNGILTYGQLFHDAACIASALECDGARRGDLVGIKLNRSREYIVSVLGCLIFGYGAVLLDIEYPQERIDYIIQDASVSTVIDGTFYDKAIEADIPAAYVPVSPETCAVVVYTSGSTGNPKGVLHDQRSAYNAVKRLFRLLPYNEADLCGSTVPYTFIAIGLDFLYHLCLGATVDIIPRNVVRDPDALSEYISGHGITAAMIPPKILKVFKKTGDSLRIVATGSERVSNIAADQFRIVNIYGMSEGFPSICSFEIDQPYDCTPIGRGDGSLGIYLLDENGNEAEEGEICISGHLFSGYVNLKEQTEQVLCPNPFREIDGHDTIFHTNDIGRRLPDGNIQYVNRKDWMIKINGFRVEPGEIENAVKELPQIFDAAVKAFVRENGTPYLAAYYVEKTPVSVDGIRQAMIRRFPYYMVPAYYSRLEALPVNNNGKLDHKALTAPETANAAAHYVAPTNPLEEALCKSMAKVLCVKKVGIKDDFFYLGGNYEEVLQLVKEFSAYGLVEKVIYKYKTPEKICMALLHMESSNHEAENMLALSVPQPLTRAQQYFLDCQLYAPKEKLANNSLSFSVPVSNIDAAVLKKLLEDNFKLHPALASGIGFSEDGELVQTYHKGEFVPVECFTCTEEEFENSIKKNWTRKLPSMNSLLYYCLIYTTELRHHILFDIHRAICDEQGIINFFRGVMRSYEGKKVPADYLYVYLSRMDLEKKKYLDLDAMKRIQAFIDDDSFSLSLRKDADSREVVKSVYCFESAGCAGDYAAAMEAHQTPFEQLLIASALLAMGRFNASDKVAVNWLFNGRSELWEKDIVGPMAAAIPVGAVLSEYTSIIGLMKEIREQCNVAIEYSDSLTFLGSNPGLKDLMEIGYIDRSLLSPDDLLGIDAELDTADINAGQLNLLAVRGREEDKLYFRVLYNSACYKAESIERFAALFAKAFELCCFGTLKDW